MFSFWSWFVAYALVLQHPLAERHPVWAGLVVYLVYTFLMTLYKVLGPAVREYFRPMD